MTPAVTEAAAGVTALVGMGAAGAGAGASMAVGLTFSEVWGPLAFILGLLVALVGVVWNQQQKEIGALRTSVEGMSAKLDRLLAAQHAHELAVAHNYVTRTELAQAAHIVPKA